jgi:outer membrane biosynthesis protein TonB
MSEDDEQQQQQQENDDFFIAKTTHREDDDDDEEEEDKPSVAANDDDDDDDDGAPYAAPSQVEQAAFRSQTLLRALTHAKEARIASLRNKARRARDESERKLAQFGLALTHIDAIAAALDAADAAADSIALPGNAASLPRAVAKVAVDRHRRALRQDADLQRCADVDVAAWHQRVVETGRREFVPLSDGERSVALITTAAAALFSYEKWRRQEAGFPPLLSANRKRSLQIRQQLALKQQQRAASNARQTGLPVVAPSAAVAAATAAAKWRDKKPKQTSTETKEPTTTTPPPPTKERPPKERLPKERPPKRERKEKPAPPPVYASRPQATRARVTASNGYASQTVKLSSLFLDSLSGERPPADAVGAKQKRPAPSSADRSAKQTRSAAQVDGGGKSFVRPWERKANTDVKATRTTFS